MTVKKTLIALGVMSTLGVSAGAIAGSTSHPLSVSDSTPWLSLQHQQSARVSGIHPSIGSTSSSAGGSLAATVDEGAYSDFYVVGLMPVMEEWDYYIISPSASTEDAYFVGSADENYFVLSAADDDSFILSAADEDMYVLSPGYYSVVTLHTFDDSAMM